MACLHLYKSFGYPVEGIFVDYGQSAAIQELSAAKNIASYYSSELKTVVCNDLPKRTGEIIARNALLINLALYLVGEQSAFIAMGIHAGTLYSDCSEPFKNSMQDLLDLYTDGNVRLTCPFLNWAKLDIWNYSMLYELPIHLTYSCERGTLPPCGECPSCRDMEALRLYENQRNNSS